MPRKIRDRGREDSDHPFLVSSALVMLVEQQMKLPRREIEELPVGQAEHDPPDRPATLPEIVIA
jgi:hypothetical protein